MFTWQTGDPVTFQSWWQSSGASTLDLFHNVRQPSLQGWKIKTPTNHSNYPNKGTLQHFYPVINITKKCTMMLVHKFHDIRWLQVNCDGRVFNSVFCHIFTEQGQEIIEQPCLLSCSLDSIKINRSCFSFQWCPLENTCFSCLHDTSHAYHLFLVLEYLLDTVLQAAKVDYLSVTPQRNFDDIFHNLLAFKQGYYHIDKRLGTCVKQSKVILSGIESMLCKHKVTVSVLLFCDGKVDCSPNDNTDEANCVCKGNDTGPTMCKHVFHQGKKSCNKLYYMTKSQLCVPYMIRKSSVITTETQQQTELPFLRVVQDKNNKTSSRANPSSITDDSFKLTSTCTDRGKLLCRKNEHICFNISDICIFKLTKLFTLIPCETGDHLQNCQNFQCNMMFKCPHVYCVPWGYVCDGKWDCQLGLDEVDELNCGLSRICTDLFKCQNSQKCVHQGNICDQVVDCPYADDEELCDVARKQCPGICTCLAYAIWCEHSVLFAGPGSTDFSTYLAIFLLNCTVQSISQTFTSGITLSIISCGLTKICDTTKMIKQIVYINLSSNNATLLESNCFHSTQFAKEILLQNNELSTIHPSAFCGLHELLHLDLSGNDLIQIQSQLSFTLTKLKWLNLNNSKCQMEDLDSEIFHNTELKLLQTSCTGLCCLASQCTVSSSEMQHLCWDLLPNPALKYTFYSTSGLMFLTTGLCVILQVVSVVKQINKTALFPVIVLSTNGADFLYLVYLATLWASDLHYQDTFPNVSQTFASSATCYTAMFFAAYFMLLSPVIRMFKSLSRLMVVLKPLDSVFLEMCIVAKWISLIACICLPVALSCTLLTRYLYLRSYSVICLSLIDPAHSQVLDNILVWFLLFLHTGIIVGQIVMHLLLCIELQKSSKKVAKERSHKSIITQLVVLSVCNTVCWLTFDAVCITLLFLNTYPHNLTIWTTVVTPSANIIATAVVFAVTTIRKMLK